jgi:hypothetical protein
MTLKYTGAGVGAASIDPPVPARDLTDEEVAAFGGEAAILKIEHNGTPLYERVGGSPDRRSTRPIKADGPDKDGE